MRATFVAAFAGNFSAMLVHLAGKLVVGRTALLEKQIRFHLIPKLLGGQLHVICDAGISLRDAHRWHAYGSGAPERIPARVSFVVAQCFLKGCSPGSPGAAIHARRVGPFPVELDAADHASGCGKRGRHDGEQEHRSHIYSTVAIEGECGEE